jgi:hypothetical protein
LRDYSRQANLIYAVNLTGSAMGCLLALLLPGIIGAVGLVVFCSLLAVIVSFSLMTRQIAAQFRFSRIYIFVMGIISVFLLVLCISDLYLRIIEDSSLNVLKLNISPYKGISYALQYPGAEIVYQEWNAYSRVDLVSSDGIRSLPGLSYLTESLPPKQSGLFIDGDDLNPVIQDDNNKKVTDYLPTSIAYGLRTNADVLILEPRGGLEIVIAQSEGAKSITTTEPNPLVVKAAHNIYEQDHIINHLESGRSFLRRTQELFDVIVISQNSSFHPVRSGAYSLGEDYRYTIEAFEEAMSRLRTDGLLILTRWLQTPPSEFLRAFGIALEAIGNVGGNHRRSWLICNTTHHNQ